MSWSISCTGTKAEVLASLRKQMHSSDQQHGQPHPVGMGDTEYALRRALSTVLYQAVMAHNVSGSAKGNSFVGTMTQISASAWGSETRDTETGESYQDVGLQVMTSAEG